jgi:SAM-dependent methyltransferase
MPMNRFFNSRRIAVETGTRQSAARTTAPPHYELDVIRCPNCSGILGPDLACRSCGTAFHEELGVLELLPSALDTVKQLEDSVFADGSADRRKFAGRPWRMIVGRKEITRFDQEILDQLPPGRFLEIGGELCWAACMVKSVRPDSVAYGTDVSPNALRHGAVPAAQMFPRAPDYLIAVDAECLPFADGTFDAVFASTMIHHLPHPSRMFDEVDRILKPGGRLIAVDAAIPRHFRWVFSGIAAERSGDFGMQEDLIPWTRWEQILKGSRVPVSALSAYTKPDYQYSPLFMLAGRLIDRLPQRLARALFPVGVLITYTKP